MKANQLWMWISLFALAGCAGTQHVAAVRDNGSSGGLNVVNVVATEYAFQAPDTVPAGPTLFRFSNGGTQLHHMTLVRFEDGKRFADFTAASPGERLPPWAVFAGGANAVPPHGRDETAVDLAPGDYAVICVIPGSDGKPHFMKGMVKELKVTPPVRQAAMPAADVTITLAEYVLQFSAPITSGHHAIRVVNHGHQPHELVLIHMKAGKTGRDMADWVATGMHGPPPGMPIGGASPLAPGEENTVLVDLARGDYAVMCLLPDAGDGKMHAMHGMVHDFTVL